MAEFCDGLQEAQTEASMQLPFSRSMLTEIAAALLNCKVSPIKARSQRK
jgi:hypothetical protein